MNSDEPAARAGDGACRAGLSTPLVIATILRAEGTTGVHTHVRELRNYLWNQGDDAVLVTPFSRRPLFSEAAFAPRPVLDYVSGPAAVIWYRHWHEVFLADALRLELAERDEVVIYAQGPEAARAALAARRGPHQRVVTAVHFQSSQADGWVEKGRIREGRALYRAIRKMEHDILPRVDGLVYVSRSARDHVLRWLPEVADVPSEVISNFTALVPVPPAREIVGDLVSVGGLDRAKNHQYLLEVVAAARDKGKAMTLDLFGEGPCRKELERSAAELGLSDQVRFHGYRRDVRRLLPGYRAYVHASKSETGPLAIIEAMACGLPIVAGRIGGVTELVDDGVEGWFWCLNDPHRAAVTLIDVLEDGPALAAAAVAARRRFEMKLQADAVAPRLLSFLERAAPARRPRSLPVAALVEHRPGAGTSR
jgi:glycosyltransferase involved in cell wall biosynthesis